MPHTFSRLFVGMLMGKIQLQAFVLALSLLASQAEASPTCESLFKPATKSFAQTSVKPSSVRFTAADFIQRSEKAEPSTLKKAEFAEPAYEQAAAKTWGGTNSPVFMSDSLVPGTRLISHGLKEAGESGVVKTTSGNMIHLRSEIAGFETNIGVTLQSIRSNGMRTRKSYVAEDAKAAIIFIHGGGTNTTGHHVAANVLDYFNARGVSVISMDLPWHGEGPRSEFTDIRAEFMKFRETVLRLIGGSKGSIKLVLSGHSMGGVFADRYRREFPNDTLFDAVIPLSPVADVAPGRSQAEKLAREIEIEKLNEKNENIPEEERNLGRALAQKGKISPTCGAYCSAFMFGMDWAMPAHRGQQYLPALYIIGRGDGLYQNAERAWTQGVADLAKTEFIVFDKRRDIKERGDTLMDIGHLIFDHKPLVWFDIKIDPEIRRMILAGEFESATAEKSKAQKTRLSKAQFDQLRRDGLVKVGSFRDREFVDDPQFQFEDLASPETYVRMKNFIAKVVGEPLPVKPPSLDPIDYIVYEYANNLAFREFAKSHVYLHMRATDKVPALQAEQADLGRRSKAIMAELKKNGKLSPESEAESKKIEARRGELMAIFSQKGIVTDANRARFEQITNEIARLRTLLSNSAPKTAAVVQELKKKTEEVRLLLEGKRESILQHEHRRASDRHLQAVEAHDAALKAANGDKNAASVKAAEEQMNQTYTRMLSAEQEMVKAANQEATQVRYEQLLGDMVMWEARLVNHLPDRLKLLQESEKQSILKLRKVLAVSGEKLDTPEVRAARVERDRIFDLLMASDGRIRELTGANMVAKFKDGRFTGPVLTELTPELQAEYRTYESLKREYMQSLSSYGSIMMEGLIAKRDVDAITYESHVNAFRAITVRLGALAKRRAVIANRFFQLEAERAALLGQDYFVAEKHTIDGLLSQSVESLMSGSPQEIAAKRTELNSMAQKLWGDWGTVWGGRPQSLSEDGGLY